MVRADAPDILSLMMLLLVAEFLSYAASKMLCSFSTNCWKALGEYGVFALFGLPFFRCGERIGCGGIEPSGLKSNNKGRLMGVVRVGKRHKGLGPGKPGARANAGACSSLTHRFTLSNVALVIPLFTDNAMVRSFSVLFTDHVEP